MFGRHRKYGGFARVTKGVHSLCGVIRYIGLDPTNGYIYVFVNSSRKVMKLLHWERGGFVVYYKRLSHGRFHSKIFLRTGIGFRSMRWDELVLKIEYYIAQKFVLS